MIDFVDRNKKEDRKGSSKLESLLDLIPFSTQKLLWSSKNELSC